MNFELGSALALMLLAFETSCDETSAAVIERGRVLSNVVSSQVQLHAEYGGVVGAQALIGKPQAESGLFARRGQFPS